MKHSDLFLLDEKITFLNHGSFGATPRSVFEQYQYWQRELERQPVEFLGRRFQGLMQKARESLAQYVNVAADNLIFTPNVTQGLNIVAHSLKLQAGDEVLTTNHEYGALDRMWRFLCAKQQAVYINQPLPYPITDTNAIVEEIWSQVTAKTRVLFISHITSPTAIILPIRELIQRARQHGIISIIDGAHALGQIPLDLTALDPDFYSGNAHKWLCAPKGCAFLYARPNQQALVEPLIVSWGWQADKPSHSRFIDEQEWQGTRDPAAYLSLPAAIDFARQYGHAQSHRECHDLTQYARQQLLAVTGQPPITPDSTLWYQQMVSVPLPACDADDLKMRLYDDYGIEVPIIAWHEQIFVRVSIQIYNTVSDVDKLVQALQELLA